MTHIETVERIEQLWNCANLYASHSPQLAQYYLLHMVETAELHHIELAEPIRKSFCPTCFSLYLPVVVLPAPLPPSSSPVGARVRVEPLSARQLKKEKKKKKRKDEEVPTSAIHVRCRGCANVRVVPGPSAEHRAAVKLEGKRIRKEAEKNRRRSEHQLKSTAAASSSPTASTTTAVAATTTATSTSTTAAKAPTTFVTIPTKMAPAAKKAPAAAAKKAPPSAAKKAPTTIDDLRRAQDSAAWLMSSKLAMPSLGGRR